MLSQAACKASVGGLLACGGGSNKSGGIPKRGSTDSNIYRQADRDQSYPILHPAWRLAFPFSWRGLLLCPGVCAIVSPELVVVCVFMRVCVFGKGSG